MLQKRFRNYPLKISHECTAFSIELKQGQLRKKIFRDCLFQSVDIFKSLTNKMEPLLCPSVRLLITSVTLTDFSSLQIMKLIKTCQTSFDEQSPNVLLDLLMQICYI